MIIFFATIAINRSHKKDHSILGSIDEQLGLRVKDVLEANNDMVGFFDGSSSCCVPSMSLLISFSLKLMI